MLIKWSCFNGNIVTNFLKNPQLNIKYHSETRCHRWWWFSFRRPHSASLSCGSCRLSPFCSSCLCLNSVIALHFTFLSWYSSSRSYFSHFLSVLPSVQSDSHIGIGQCSSGTEVSFHFHCCTFFVFSWGIRRDVRRKWRWRSWFHSWTFSSYFLSKNYYL